MIVEYFCFLRSRQTVPYRHLRKISPVPLILSREIIAVTWEDLLQNWCR